MRSFRVKWVFMFGFFQNSGCKALKETPHEEANEKLDLWVQWVELHP